MPQFNYFYNITSYKCRPEDKNPLLTNFVRTHFVNKTLFPQTADVTLIFSRGCHNVVAVKTVFNICGAGKIAHSRIPLALVGAICAAGHKFYGRGRERIANIPGVSRIVAC